METKGEQIEIDRVKGSFQNYRVDLDHFHDKYEKVFKISRDITIESKRLIYTLHRITDTSKEEITKDSDKALEKIKDHWDKVAKELEDEDPYHFAKAYTNGMQEYIEALSFKYFLEFKKLITWEEVCSELTFIEPLCTRTVMVSHKDFILGIADLSGELMRLCINKAAQGNIESCYEICIFLRRVSEGFSTLPFHGVKDLKGKVNTLRQSLQKVENACYTLNVRGSEIPRSSLKDILNEDKHITDTLLDNF